MRQLTSSLARLVLGLLCSAASAAPVELLEADSQAFLQDNGALDVIYELQFRENKSRSEIRKIGQFYEPVHFTRAWIRDGARQVKAVSRAPSAAVTTGSRSPVW